MASYDYHNRSYPPSHRADAREDQPLPPLPSDSHFDDDAHYAYSHAEPSQSYDDMGGRQHDDPDPFDDDHAIPMRTQITKHDSQSSMAPVLPQNHSDDFIRDAKSSRRRSVRRKGKDVWYSGPITWVCYVLTVVQLSVFIAEIVKNAVLTKSPIEIHPTFNPMVGPSPYVLINMGARYVPCMHNVPNVQNSTINIEWPCPNATDTTGDSITCSLSDLCGFSGVPNPHIGGNVNEQPAPNQWFRFIVPIFLHAGIIHISFNLLLQMTLGRDVEKMIGSIRFAMVYFAAGIFGFVLGGNFASTGIASTGCSGSLFGILAITLLDLLYTWKQRTGPIKDLLFICVDVIIAFVLGLLPGLDNFSHIGGFLMGLVLGVCVLRSPPALSRRINDTPMPYQSYMDLGDPIQHSNHSNPDEGLRGFIKRPLGFFQGRRGVWWAWWLVRAFALIGALIGFILLLKNFYVWRTECSWCKYLSCINVNNWCNVGNLQFTSQNGTSTNKRDLLQLTREVFEGV